MVRFCFRPAIDPGDNAKTKCPALGRSFSDWQRCLSTSSPRVTACAAAYFSFFDVIPDIPLTQVIVEREIGFVEDAKQFVLVISHPF